MWCHVTNVYMRRLHAVTWHAVVSVSRRLLFIINNLLLIMILSTSTNNERISKTQAKDASATAFVWHPVQMFQGCRGDWILMPIPIPYPQKNLWESPQNPHIHRIPKSSIPIPYTLCIFVWCIYHFIFCHVCPLYVVSQYVLRLYCVMHEHHKSIIIYKSN